MIYQEMHPVFHYLVGDVQINTLTDAVPFTVAPSFKDKNTLTYTTTGPKEQRAFAVGCWILGPPWFVGGVMLLFANNPNLTAPAWVAYPVLLGGGLLFCINGYRRWGASKRRNQVEINIDTHEIIWAKKRDQETLNA